MGVEALEPGGVGGVLQLPHEPVDPGGGAALAGRVEVDVAGGLPGAQVGGDDEVADGVGDADGAGALSETRAGRSGARRTRAPIRRPMRVSSGAKVILSGLGTDAEDL